MSMRLLGNSLNMHSEERQLEKRKLILRVCQQGNCFIANTWHPSVDGSFDLDHARRVEADYRAKGYGVELTFQEAN